MIAPPAAAHAVRRPRAGWALLVVLLVATAACGRETDGAGRMAKAAAVERQACTAAVPTGWTESIARSAVGTGGLTTFPRAVGPAGEVVAVRDSGSARDLVLVGADRSVRELYALPEPDVFVFGYVGIDDRWIVFAVEHLPRNANGVLPQTKRIEVMDRQTGARRTVAEQSTADAAAVPERNVLDSVVLSDGKVYWITRDEYNGQTGVVHAFDPSAGTRTDIASGSIRDLLAGPAGSAWSTAPGSLPPAVAALPPADLESLGTDGTAYGWISGAANGRAGIGYWSAATGMVKVEAIPVDVTKFLTRVLVFDSFVILAAGGSTTTLGTAAIFVDTRSGAVVTLTPRTSGNYDQVVASMGGTLALALWAGPGRGSKQPDYGVGLLRSGTLAAPTC